MAWAAQLSAGVVMHRDMLAALKFTLSLTMDEKTVGGRATYRVILPAGSDADAVVN